MTDQAYYEQLSKHDWTHQMSDSGYVYEKGAKVEAALKAETTTPWRRAKFREWKAYAHRGPETVERPTFDAKPETVASEEKAVHSKVSPSNLKNLDGCPHYESEHQEELTDMHPNTVEGLRVHLEVELYFDPDKEDKLEGQDVELYEGIKQDHVDRAQYAIDYAERALKEKGADPDTLVTEPRLHTPLPNTYGRCDLLAIWDASGHAQIFDWKDGNHWQGDADNNLQGHAYALGVLHEYPDVESVEVHFVYTRREEETVATFTRAKHYKKFLEMVVKINREFDLVHTTGAQMQRKCDSCQFCVLQTGCPQWAPMVPAVVGQSKLQGTDALPSTWKLEELCELPEEVGKALTVMSFFKKYDSELKDLALSMVRDEDMTIPGQALVESNSGIKCSDPQGAYEASLESGVPVEDFLETVRTISAGKLVDKMARAVAASSGATIVKAKKEVRENLLEEGVLSSGNSYEYLRQSKEA